jgi:hypothetical protein
MHHLYTRHKGHRRKRIFLLGALLYKTACIECDCAVELRIAMFSGVHVPRNDHYQRLELVHIYSEWHIHPSSLSPFPRRKHSFKRRRAKGCQRWSAVGIRPSVSPSSSIGQLVGFAHPRFGPYPATFKQHHQIYINHVRAYGH